VSITSLVLDQPMAALPEHYLFILTFSLKMEAANSSVMLATQLTATWCRDAETDTTLRYVCVAKMARALKNGIDVVYQCICTPSFLTLAVRYIF
jgi:hypothetical protein